mgnify:CR=1 FL=1
MLRVALPNKGQLSDPAREMLREAGYLRSSAARELVVQDPDNDVEFFFLRPKDIAVYVSLFAIGHSTTMVLGVYFNIGINSHLIDAVIGFSVVYKALDNLGAFQRWFGVQPNTKVATLVFGLIHGFGLATKIQEYEISRDGLVPNLLAFNVGVEIGQLLALFVILIAMSYWRRTPSFVRHAYTANVAMMSAGFVLVGMQLTGYFVS